MQDKKEEASQHRDNFLRELELELVFSSGDPQIQFAQIFEQPHCIPSRTVAEMDVVVEEALEGEDMDI